MNGNGNTTAVNSFGAAGLLSRHGASSVYYTFDPQGNVCQRLDGAQNILSTSVFDAYGTNLTGSTGEPWGYEGQAGYYTDTETGLTANTYRYYDPSQGRWLNRDPIGQAGGVNLYGYVGNGPVDDDDPDGLLPGGLGGAHNTTPPIDGWPALSHAVSCAWNVYDTVSDALDPNWAINQLADTALVAACSGSAPSLPPSTIVNSRGVRIRHHFQDGTYPDPAHGVQGEHRPAHCHVEGQGREVEIGKKGFPLEGQPELSPVQQQVVDENLQTIARACKKIAKWIKWVREIPVE